MSGEGKEKKRQARGDRGKKWMVGKGQARGYRRWAIGKEVDE